MQPLSDCTVTVIGLGLMGGSLAGALRGHCKEVIGVDRDTAIVEAAVRGRFADRGTVDLAEGVAGADIVVLATPVRTIVRLLGELGPLVHAEALLMDLGSTKTQILKAMAHLPDTIQPLGGHPMCGKETSGIAAADIALFRERTFILSPLPRTSPEALELGASLAKAVGAMPLVIGAERQDFLVGTLSHLPYLLACSLVSTADVTTSADPLVWHIPAGGFRDTSRVAGSDVTMMLDILMTNRGEIVKAARLCADQLDQLIQLVEEGDETRLGAELSRIQRIRKEMYP
ncbi:MAG: prephenate dehydrogenase [Anaerolineae bacterium]|jgi:prephenate dehydrogenase|nr:prephenate dehydrogenase [Anaerolineae bacterium]